MTQCEAEPVESLEELYWQDLSKIPFPVCFQVFFLFHDVKLAVTIYRNIQLILKVNCCYRKQGRLGCAC